MGKKAESIQSFIDEFGSLKPCIHGSDAHSIDTICKPDSNRYCWIKADTTFEGLKQILYEPEERIRVQEDNPEPRKNIYTISSFEISKAKIKQDLEIEEFNLHLNPNLISVIGGKGDGKTAFLDLVANCFEDRSSGKCNDENSFVIRIEEQKPNFEVKLAFCNKETFCKKVLDNNYHLKSKITYLPQKHFEEYSANREKLQNKIEEIIFNNMDVKASGYTQQYHQIMDKIKSTQKSIKVLNASINRLEEETNFKIISDLKKKLELKNGELINKEDQIKRSQQSYDEDLKVDVEKLKNEEKNLRIKKDKLRISSENCVSIKTSIEELSTLNTKINAINDELAANQINIKIERIATENQMKLINDSMQMIDSAIKDTESGISEKEADINKLSGIEKDYALFISERDNIRKDIADLDLKLNEIETKKEQMGSCVDQRMRQFFSICQNLDELNESYNKIIGVFSQEKDDILNNIDFKSNIFCNKKKFVESGVEILDLRKISSQQIEDLADSLCNIMISKERCRERCHGIY